jgi:NAD+ diphosphatase
MVACIAEAENEDINLDDDELEHAFWVSREEVQAAYNPDCADPVFIIPPPQAIAYNLMYHWAFNENG